jgi:hypothetical protein
MADWNWVAFAVAVLGAVLVGTGLVSGRMPLDVQSIEPDRVTRPKTFWLVGGAYLAVAAIGAWLFVTSTGQ